MIRKHLAAALILFAGAGTAAAQEKISGAFREFVSPEDSTRTKVWWFHGETRTTREGITADLRAYRDAGIGGVVYYDQVHGSGEGAAKVFSREWWDALLFSASEAKRLGLSFEINLSNGYVAGGPWIGKPQGMKRLTSSELTVEGGRKIQVTLPVPTSDDWFCDVALLAFPAPEGCSEDIDITAGLAYSGNAFTARSVTYTAPKHRKSRNGAMNYPNGPAEKFYGMMYYDPDPAGWLECSDDGITWRTVCELPTPGGSSGLAQRTIAFEPVTAPHFRIRTGADISQAVLSSRPKTDRWEEKGAYFSEFYTGNDTPQYKEGIIDRSDILDLTGKMDASGRLTWDAPAGKWTIMRIAEESTRGATKHGRRDALGLECDKMSKEAVNLHWNSYAKRIIDTLSVHGLKPKGVTMDSHEAGPQNWTEGFPGIFLKRNGYDIIPMLPAMRGYIIDSTEKTEEFLHDVRTTINAAIADNYYSELDRLCTLEGIEFTAQAAGNGLSLVADNIMLKGRPGKPQGEFWARDIHGSYDIIDCASAAHIYGRRIASGEAFTDAKYSDSPATLKMLADFAYASLINEFVVCASAYQPETGVVPGNVANGRQYCLNRNNTIWPYSRPFWDYQARCAGLLRKGKPVVDILVYTGDDAPAKTLAHLLPVIPEGYNFDTATADALEGASVKDGRLVLRSGTSYGMLVIQRNASLPSDMTDRWMAAGLPVAHPSGVNEEVHVPFAQDMAFSSGRSMDDCVRFGHRRLDDADVYFVYNHSRKPYNDEIRLRSGYGKVYGLDPLDGSCTLLSESASLNLELEPDQSIFLVATDASLPAGKMRKASGFKENDLSCGWKVTFGTKMGGSGKAVKLDTLEYWTENSDERIKYYSGTAVYEKSFKMKETPGIMQHAMLEFEDLQWMAKVIVNGQEAGTVWCSPWRIDIAPYLKKGRNTIRLEVTNSLYNRMIGDLGKKEDERFTHSSYPLVDQTTPLVPSGIRGKVVIR